MYKFCMIIILALLVGSNCVPLPWDDLKIISRETWGAKPPKLKEPMPNPVPFVVIHHSYTPEACNTTVQCIRAMQEMQRMHQDDRGWNDIGYSFGVGGDGNAYYGRGWDTVGAHAPPYNNKSIGICVIGDWRTELPPKQQLDKVQQLIEYGVHKGYIQEDYHLIGHRQARNTECPGDRLYHLIQTWDHYCSNPRSGQCSENTVST